MADEASTRITTQLELMTALLAGIVGLLVLQLFVLVVR